MLRVKNSYKNVKIQMRIKNVREKFKKIFAKYFLKEFLNLLVAEILLNISYPFLKNTSLKHFVLSLVNTKYFKIKYDIESFL